MIQLKTKWEKADRNSILACCLFGGGVAVTRKGLFCECSCMHVFKVLRLFRPEIGEKIMLHSAQQ